MTGDYHVPRQILGMKCCDCPCRWIRDACVFIIKMQSERCNVASGMWEWRVKGGKSNANVKSGTLELELEVQSESERWILATMR